MALAVVGLTASVVFSGQSAAGPVGPVAGVQDDHLPVDPLSSLANRVKLIAETKTTTTRVDLFWGDIAPTEPRSPADPADPSYRFERADLILTELIRRGITPIVDVYDTPTWASRTPMSSEPPVVNKAVPAPEHFASFMKALAARYSGSFVTGEGRRLPAVRYFELWNEPNLDHFLSPRRKAGEPSSLDAYAQMVRPAYRAIKEANPAAVVLVGSGGPSRAMSWLRGLRARDVPLDAYSQHVYPGAAPLLETTVVPSWSSVGRIIDELNAWHQGLPLYITEAGYTTAPTPYRDVQVTEAEQASYLRQIFALPQLQTTQIKVVIWFNLQDNADWPAGLIRADLARKPSYRAFLEAVDAQHGARLP